MPDIVSKHALRACLLGDKMGFWLLISLIFLCFLKSHSSIAKQNKVFPFFGGILEQPTSIHHYLSTFDRRRIWITATWKPVFKFYAFDHPR